MILPDVNVLIYAFRPDASQHAASRSWLMSVVTANARFGLSKLALSALVRVTTNPRSYATPSAVSEAFAFCDDLLGQPHCQLVEPGERHWGIFQNLCTAVAATGNDLTDAWYAALAIEWGCEWITFDRDFSRYPGLKCTILPASTS
jgi:toxin-antitoxin system PIN domain toxin